jgi:hypothetical protein
VLLAWRMRRLGARTAFAHEAVVHHAVLPGTARGYLSERARVRLFPALVARVPELRDVFLHRGLFLTRRSLRFDAAVAGALLAAATRRPWPLAAVLPYAALVRAEAGGRTPGERRRVAATHVAADAIAFGGLLAGSARSRAVVL